MDFGIISPQALVQKSSRCGPLGLHLVNGLRHHRPMTRELSVESAGGPGAGWIVRGVGPNEPVHSFATKSEAEAHARLALATSELGGVLALYRVDGSLIRRIRIRGVAPASPGLAPIGPSPDDAGRNAVAQIYKEGKQVDRGLDWGVDLLVVAFGSAFSALVSSTVLQAAGSGWVAVALATFTWTAGCATIWFLAVSGRANGAPLFMGLGPIVFFVSASVATVIGRGELALMRDGTVSLAGIINNAFDAYGPFGAFIGLGIGVWIGSRLAQQFPK